MSDITMMPQPNQPTFEERVASIVEAAKKQCEIDVVETNGQKQITKGFMLISFDNMQPNEPIFFGAINKPLLLDMTKLVIKQIEYMEKQQALAGIKNAGLKSALASTNE